MNPGDAAEAEVLRVVREYFPDAQTTVGSGNVNGDGDIAGLPVHLEVKDQSGGEGFTVRKAEWEKTRQQALRWQRHPVLVIRNKGKKLLAVCDPDLLMLALSYVPKGVL